MQHGLVPTLQEMMARGDRIPDPTLDRIATLLAKHDPEGARLEYMPPEVRVEIIQMVPGRDLEWP